MAEPTREQYAELHDRIVAALPVDPDDGTTVIGYGPEGFPLWGDPAEIARAIEAAFFRMDLHVVPGDDLHRLLADLDGLRARLAAVDALHQPAPQRLHGVTCCAECCGDWPCPTNVAMSTTTQRET